MQLLHKAGFTRRQLRCYCLINYDFRATPEVEEERLKFAWDAGTLPFAQLYREPIEKRQVVSIEWRDLQRNWSRPAIIKSRMQGKK